MPPTKRTTTTPALPVAARDDLRQRLTELRDLLTDQLRAGAPAAYVAPLSRQLQSVLIELAALPPANPDDMVTRLLQKRAERMAAEGIPEPPAQRRRIPSPER